MDFRFTRSVDYYKQSLITYRNRVEESSDRKKIIKITGKLKHFANNFHQQSTATVSGAENVYATLMIDKC